MDEQCTRPAGDPCNYVTTCPPPVCNAGQTVSSPTLPMVNVPSNTFMVPPTVSLGGSDFLVTGAAIVAGAFLMSQIRGSR